MKASRGLIETASEGREIDHVRQGRHFAEWAISGDAARRRERRIALQELKALAEWPCVDATGWKRLKAIGQASLCALGTIS
jgi:hypothetical protein